MADGYRRSLGKFTAIALVKDPFQEQAGRRRRESRRDRRWAPQKRLNLPGGQFPSTNLYQHPNDATYHFPQEV